ncbi:hypothetical protein [Trinickia sp.]|uniref:hypothetical protein n=1 Tax=Trinickia sp. TaxID=2571163 RepID=UPI003F7DE98E
MNAASSERLVVFVTPAQKRVLAARAERMGISLSELVRRAVLAFDETGQEVRAAGLIDRLGAASEASLRDPLRRLAQAAPREHERGLPVASSGAAAARAEAADDKADHEANHKAARACGSPIADGPAAALPVAAAVARALVASEAAEPEHAADPETQALVGRLLDSESTRSV